MGRIGVFEFAAPVWLHSGGSWHFLTVPEDVSDDIRDLTEGRRGGFGSVRVAVTIGRTRWRTSVFPVAADGTFVLPVKKAVRAAEDLEDGDPAKVRLELVDL
jgi:hypothetical protein